MKRRHFVIAAFLVLLLTVPTVLLHRLLYTHAGARVPAFDPPAHRERPHRGEWRRGHARGPAVVPTRRRGSRRGAHRGRRLAWRTGCRKPARRQAGPRQGEHRPSGGHDQGPRAPARDGNTLSAGVAHDLGERCDDSTGRRASKGRHAAALGHGARRRARHTLANRRGTVRSHGPGRAPRRRGVPARNEPARTARHGRRTLATAGRATISLQRRKRAAVSTASASTSRSPLLRVSPSPATCSTSTRNLARSGHCGPSRSTGRPGSRPDGCRRSSGSIAVDASRTGIGVDGTLTSPAAGAEAIRVHGSGRYAADKLDVVSLRAWMPRTGASLDGLGLGRLRGERAEARARRRMDHVALAAHGRREVREPLGFVPTGGRDALPVRTSRHRCGARACRRRRSRPRAGLIANN